MSIQTTATRYFERLHDFDKVVCQRFNRVCEHRGWVNYFRIVSRLGDGVFWYALVVLLPLIYGAPAWYASFHLVAVGISGLVVYKLIKQGTCRSRPCHRYHTIIPATRPLDLYSFPSGHTLHAVSGTVTVTHYYPELFWICAPFTICVALSRVVLGLHYPSDVFAGMAVGGLLAAGSFLFF
ncbi:MAG: phosphatase PAP2 family protein [Granulosicoccaceae bacterium]|jgi:undecaprenyl-diphosphatase